MTTKLKREEFYKINGKPHIKLSHCIFLDILGFSDEIILNDKKRNSQKHLNKIYRVVEEAYNILKENGEDDKFRYFEYKLFSDNLIVCIPFNFNNISALDEPNLGTLVELIIDYQFHFVKNGFFLRGGWDIGNLFFDDKLIYGKVLIDSYKIEKCKACMPKIEVSDSIRILILAQIKKYSETIESPHYDVFMRENEKFFVNYLSKVINEFTGDINYEELKKHKKVIEAKLKLYKKSIRKIKEKYEWVAYYHNYFCSQIHPKLSENFLINIDESIHYNIELI